MGMCLRRIKKKKKNSHLQAFIAQQTITLHKLLNTKYVRSFGETNTYTHGLHRDSNPDHQVSQSTSLPLRYRDSIKFKIKKLRNSQIWRLWI
jgi:hypothetical protein